MTRPAPLLILSLLSLLVLAVPASANDVYAPCTNTLGAAGVVGVDAPLSLEIETPDGPLIGATDAGAVIVDLAGMPVGSTPQVDFSLSWTNGILDGASDYDLEINGHEALTGGPGPETLSFTATHCRIYHVTAYNFLGTPADTLTLAATLAPTV